MSLNDAVREARRLVPHGFDLLVGPVPGNRDSSVILVLHGNTAVTCMSPDLDIQAQIAEDTCTSHRAYCCPACTNQKTMRS